MYLNEAYILNYHLLIFLKLHNVIVQLFLLLKSPSVGTTYQNGNLRQKLNKHIKSSAGFPDPSTFLSLRVDIRGSREHPPSSRQTQLRDDGRTLQATTVKGIRGDNTSGWRRFASRSRERDRKGEIVEGGLAPELSLSRREPLGRLATFEHLGAQTAPATSSAD